VDYGYDSQKRLQSVHYSNGRAARYTYNPSNRITAVADTSTGLELSVEYDEHQMPSKTDPEPGKFSISIFSGPY
jgi:YD repeat-containing protein